MSNTEMKKTSGGFVWLIVTAALACIGVDYAQDGEVNGTIYL